MHYFLLLSLSDWQICGTYPAVHQHISHLYHFLLFAGHDQSDVNYVLLPEVLDFATRLDHKLIQPGGSLLVMGAVEPEEEHFCSWWLIPTILPFVVTPKITGNYICCEELHNRSQSGMYSGISKTFYIL